MQEKHKKLTPQEYSGRIYSGWAERMTGTFSAPFVIAAALLLLLLGKQYDYALLLFSLGVLFTSYKLVDEERDKLIALEKEYDNREQRQSAIDKLWELRLSGSNLRNWGNTVVNDGDYEKWNHAYEKWRIDILREADIVDPNLEKWNHTVNVMDVSKMPPLTSQYKGGNFVLEYMIICENLNRIEWYLKNEMCLKQETYFR